MPFTHSIFFKYTVYYIGLKVSYTLFWCFFFFLDWELHFVLDENGIKKMEAEKNEDILHFSLFGNGRKLEK